MSFSNKEKQSCFDKISELYFCKNFGSTSKADLEVLLFSEYIEHCIGAGKPYDDYTLSKQLGITQSRVRTLKERKELKYPHEGFDWRVSFADSVKNAKYDESDHYVKIIIQDVNVLNEARHFIEEKGWYDECSLNKKLFRLPLDCFVEICVDDKSLADTFSSEAKRNVKNIRFLYKGIIIKHNKTEPTYTKTSLFLCEKRRFFMARTEKGVVTTI